MRALLIIPTLGVNNPVFMTRLAEIAILFPELTIKKIATPFIHHSRQQAALQAMAGRYDRLIMIDDDVILPDQAVKALIYDRSPLTFVAYPDKHDPHRLISGIWKSTSFPHACYPDPNLFTQLTPEIAIGTDDSPSVYYADWVGAGAMALSPEMYSTGCYFRLFESWSHAANMPVFMGEDCTYCLHVQTFLQVALWKDIHYRDWVNYDVIGQRNFQFPVMYFPSTKHLLRSDQTLTKES